MATERLSGGAGRVRSDATSTTPDQWRESAATIDPSRAIGGNGEHATPGVTGETSAASPTHSGNDAANIGVAAAASARGLMDSAREGASRQLTAQKDRAVTGLSSLVEVLRDSGKQPKAQEAGLASFTDGAANQLERFVDRLRTQDLRSVTSDLGRFARRRPGVFVGAAFVAGLAAARFLKSSAEDAGPVRSMAQRSYPAQTRAGSSQQPRGGTYGQSG
jgi:hypothetical protein